MAIPNDLGKELNQRVLVHPDGTRELWRDIPGYVGIYRVSDLGRIKRLPRVISRQRNKYTVATKILSLAKDAYGYLIIKLVDGNIKRRMWKVHQLVLLAFVGPCPVGMQCRHFPDKSRDNNKLINLHWGTASEQYQDKKVHGSANEGERQGSAKLTDEKVKEIFRLYESQQFTITQLGKRFKVDPVSIWNVLTRKTWRHVEDNGYVFRRRGSVGEKNPNAKLTFVLAKQIRELYESGWSEDELSKKFGVGHTTIWEVVNKLRWLKNEV